MNVNTRKGLLIAGAAIVVAGLVGFGVASMIDTGDAKQTSNTREQPAGEVGSGMPTSIVGNGDKWTSPDGVTFSVTWAARPANPDEERLYGVAGSPYLEVTTTVENGSQEPVTGVAQETVVDGVVATMEPSAPQGTFPDVLPGTTGKVTEGFTVGKKVQVRVLWVTGPNGALINGQYAEPYWVGDIK